MSFSPVLPPASQPVVVGVTASASAAATASSSPSLHTIRSPRFLTAYPVPPPAHSSRNVSNNTHTRLDPLNSRPWIYIEVFLTVSQIFASIIVLGISREERPEAPLSVWITGYAVGCAATLPLLYWRYIHPNLNLLEQDNWQTTSSTLWDTNSLSYPSLPLFHTDSERRNRITQGYHIRIGVMMERLRISLDCFFAVWFVVGNIWVFGRHPSPDNAPNLYRLCIIFLILSCINYAMPFILCVLVCCCIPCLLSVLGLHENSIENTGASPEVIAQLPTYKFKANRKYESKTKCHENNDSDSDSSTDGGILAAGTQQEREIPAEDAACSICLRKYKDDTDIRELPCSHYFHVDCVDKWLRINSSCPLCKYTLDGSRRDMQAAIGGGSSLFPDEDA